MCSLIFLRHLSEWNWNWQKTTIIFQNVIISFWWKKYFFVKQCWSHFCDCINKAKINQVSSRKQFTSVGLFVFNIFFIFIRSFIHSFIQSFIHCLTKFHIKSIHRLSVKVELFRYASLTTPVGHGLMSSRHLGCLTRGMKTFEPGLPS